MFKPELTILNGALDGSMHKADVDPLTHNARQSGSLTVAGILGKKGGSNLRLDSGAISQGIHKAA